MEVDRVPAQAPIRALIDLPYDVWPVILSYLAHPANRLPRDLLSVSATCHVLRDAAEPVLFRVITFPGPLGSPKDWAGYLQYLYQRFEKNSTLLRHVTGCNIWGWHTPLSDMSGLLESVPLVEGLLTTAFKFALAMPNLTNVRFRSLIVPSFVFQYLRTSNLRSLWMLFCDLRAVDNKPGVEGGTFRALQTLTMHDVWWRPTQFEFDDLLAAPRLITINFDHSSDFASPIDSLSESSVATDLHIAAPPGFTEEKWNELFLLFPNLQILYIDWDEDPTTLRPGPHLLSSLHTLRCPFSTASSGLIRGRPIKKVRLTYRREISPEPRVAQAIAGSLERTSVEELTFTGLNRSDYESILPHFHSRFRVVLKLTLSFSDDSIAESSFQWLTHEYRMHLPRLEQLTLGNDTLFTTDTERSLIPGPTHDEPLVRLWGGACPHLRVIALPCRTYNSYEDGWRRTNVPWRV